MTTSPSEKYDCRSCGACCQGFPLFSCDDDYYRRYGILYEMRDLYFLKKGKINYCMTKKCKNIYYKNGVYTCMIQDTKPDACILAKPGDETCQRAREFR